jgi:hypothetical protein
VKVQEGLGDQLFSSYGASEEDHADIQEELLASVSQTMRFRQ